MLFGAFLPDDRCERVDNVGHELGNYFEGSLFGLAFHWRWVRATHRHRHMLLLAATRRDRPYIHTYIHTYINASRDQKVN